MAEYIEKEEARLAVMRAGSIGNILPMLEAIPAADVSPVLHGRWVVREIGHSVISECDLCKYPVSTKWGRTNYCPRCGAKMEVDNE